MSGRPYLEQPEIHTKAPYRSAHLTQPNNLQQAFRDAQADPKKALVGCAHGIPSSFVTKILASAQPDFIWIDVEHAMFDRLTLNDAIQAAQHYSEGKTSVIVRVPKHDEVMLNTALDAGAAGIIMPHTESAQDVKDMIDRMYFGPKGHRSYSPWALIPEISNNSLYPDDDTNMTNSNNHVCLIAQIESVKGLENMEEIITVPGVHGVMLGPGDYSSDAGLPVTLTKAPHPKLLEAMGKFVETAHKHKVPLFGGVLKPEQVGMLVDAGYSAIVTFFDLWEVARCVKTNVQKTRDLLAEKHGAATNGTK